MSASSVGDVVSFFSKRLELWVDYFDEVLAFVIVVVFDVQDLRLPAA
jgi:hypothetical protein